MMALSFWIVPVRVNDIARLCHEVNRAYCEALGDDSQPDWDNAPEWQKESAVAGVRFHLGNADSLPRDSHENWLKHKKNDGWTFGVMKDPSIKEHPCMVAFEDLLKEQQAKDYIFHAIVKTLGG